MSRRIPKKWKWAGELFINTTPGSGQKLCNVVLSDTTEPPQNGLRLSFLCASMDSIRFKKLLATSELDAVLPACNRLQQLAKLGPESGGDETAFNTLLAFMDRQRKVENISSGLIFY